MEKRTLLSRAKDYIDAHHMFKGKEHVVAGISGGADSMCLLFVLLKLRDLYDLDITAVHINHMLRGKDADGDMEFVEEFCYKNDVPILTYKADIKSIAKSRGLGEEETGRLVRYNILSQVFNDEDCDLIATGHHKDDNAETVIMNAVRGSGLAGLSGMEPVNGVIIRPLLFASKKEILEFMEEEGLSYRTDESNFDNGYLRNKIRNVVIPYIDEELNERGTEHILNAAAAFRDAYSYLEECARKYLRKEEPQSLDVKRLKRRHTALVGEIIRQKIFRVSGSRKDIGKKHIDAVVYLMEKGSGSSVDLPFGVTVYRDYDKLNFVKGEPEGRDIMITLSEEPYDKGPVPREDFIKWFDRDKIKKYEIRTPEADDYLVIRGGHKKKLNRIFIDDKVPREYRDKIKVLADGNHILWYEGGRTSMDCRVTEETKNLLILKVQEGER